MRLPHSLLTARAQRLGGARVKRGACKPWDFRISADAVRAAGLNEERDAGMSDPQIRCRDALALWMRWNETFERSTAEMFASRSDPTALQDIMDQMDNMRHSAVTASQRVLDAPWLNGSSTTP